MVSIQYSNAMAELLHYLKGIRQEDINKIPTKLMNFIKENASKNYECSFDYNKPLKELDLLDETRGLIGMICYNYWCETAEQKSEYLNKLNENEKNYQQILREKYNPDNLFKNKKQEKEEIQETQMIVQEEKWYKKLINIIKRFLNPFIHN